MEHEPHFRIWLYYRSGEVWTPITLARPSRKYWLFGREKVPTLINWFNPLEYNRKSGYICTYLPVHHTPPTIPSNRKPPSTEVLATCNGLIIHRRVALGYFCHTPYWPILVIKFSYISLHKHRKRTPTFPNSNISWLKYIFQRIFSLD